MNHQKDSRQEVIIFTRYPRAGTTKTRLIPKLGAAGAARIQRLMTERIARAAGQLRHEHGVCPWIYHTGGSSRLMKEWLGPEYFYHDQAEGDLGRKMELAFRVARRRGVQRTILIGSDCPDLTSGLIREALEALQTSRMVLGPSADGGYYLIGTTSDLPDDELSLLFSDIAWGTAGVFQATLHRARRAGVTASILRELRDIDHPQDLAYFDHHSNPQ
jgi:rSAM/selenodomain-associated transferase 1